MEARVCFLETSAGMAGPLRRGVQQKVLKCLKFTCTYTHRHTHIHIYIYIYVRIYIYTQHTTMISRVSVYEDMQDLHHQRCLWPPDTCWMSRSLGQSLPMSLAVATIVIGLMGAPSKGDQSGPRGSH